MGFQKGICDLCSENCDSLKAIDGNTKNVLHTLLKIELTLTQGPVMCMNCEEMLIKCFNFKATCLRNTHYYINKEDDVKGAYLKKDVSGSAVSEDQDACVFCGNSAQTLCLDVDRGDVILRKVIERCLPDIDLGSFNKPVVCTPCRRSLEDCFHLMTNCETLDVKSEGQTKLSNLAHYTMRDLTSEVGGNPVDMVKVEEQFREDIDSSDGREVGSGLKIIKLEQMFFDDREDASDAVENKNEIFFMETEDQKVKNECQATPKNILTCEEESNKLGSIKKEEIFCEVETKEKEENAGKMEGEAFLADEEIEIKTNECGLRFEDGVLPHAEVSSSLLGSPKRLISSLEEDLSKPCITHALTDKHVSEERTSHCECCSSQTKNKYDLKNHLMEDKDALDVTIHKCSSCSFQTKFNCCLKEHLLSHRDPLEIVLHKCVSCSFQTKRIGSFKRHLLIHKNPPEVKIYKCESCLFQTKYKHCFKEHLVNHKDPLEITMVKCDSCSFQTKNIGCLKRHLLVHKDPSDVTIYKCDSCSFHTKCIEYLRRHFLVHKDPSEVTMYKCNFCSYQTKYKSALKGHFLRHKDPFEITIYKCDFCSFRAKSIEYLKSHLIVHKDPSEIKMYKCDSCSFQSKHKQSLNRHLLMHKDPSEVKMHKCESCSFETKYKSCLRKHSLLHKDSSTMYKCDYCPYQSKSRASQKIHLWVHKNYMYKRDYCSFQTKYKRSHEIHNMLQHKDPSEVTIYKCDSCPFQTKYKKYIRVHLLKHKDASATKV